MPEFARIEIRLSDDNDIMGAVYKLTQLTADLDTIRREQTGEAALLLARQRIKETSQKLRKGQ